MTLHEIILNLPSDYSEVVYKGRTYGLTRQDFNGGRSLKVFAEDLGGTDFISFNYYLTKSGPQLKACEMPVAKVHHFLTSIHKDKD